jgi:N-carbamoyl-L-amino-acid hydrolase
MRDGALNQLDLMCDITRDTAQEIAEARNLKISSIQNKSVEPVDMDERVISAFCEAADLNTPGKWRRMPSGALHDAMNLAPHMPTGMLFVPSIGGVSHAFEEDTRRDDLVAGVQVMADTVAKLATQSIGAN